MERNKRTSYNNNNMDTVRINVYTPTNTNTSTHLIRHAAYWFSIGRTIIQANVHHPYRITHSFYSLHQCSWILADYEPNTIFNINPTHIIVSKHIEHSTFYHVKIVSKRDAKTTAVLSNCFGHYNAEHGKCFHLTIAWSLWIRNNVLTTVTCMITCITIKSRDSDCCSLKFSNLCLFSC